MTKKEKGFIVAFGLVVMAALAHTGHHFELYDLTPFYEMVNFTPAEFGWGSFGLSGSFFGYKVFSDVARSRTSYREALQKHSDELKLGSDLITQKKMDRNFDQNKRIEQKLDIIMANEQMKQEALAQLETAPDAIKNLEFKKL